VVELDAAVAPGVHEAHGRPVRVVRCRAQHVLHQSRGHGFELRDRCTACAGRWRHADGRLTGADGGHLCKGSGAYRYRAEDGPDEPARGGRVLPGRRRPAVAGHGNDGAQRPKDRKDAEHARHGRRACAIHHAPKARQAAARLTEHNVHAGITGCGWHGERR
jgi:hypothetical protein